MKNGRRDVEELATIVVGIAPANYQSLQTRYVIIQVRERTCVACLSDSQACYGAPIIPSTRLIHSELEFGLLELFDDSNTLELLERYAYCLKYCSIPIIQCSNILEVLERYEYSWNIAVFEHYIRIRIVFEQCI